MAPSTGCTEPTAIALNAATARKEARGRLEHITVTLDPYLYKNAMCVGIPGADERGVALFRWPNVADVWHTYLSKFVGRYGGRKLERARDLFEQALDGCPPKYAKSKGGYGGVMGGGLWGGMG